MTLVRTHALDRVPWMAERVAAMVAGEVDLPTAAPRPQSLADLKARSGPAWSDEAFVRSLEDEHRALDAPPTTTESLRALREGAPCVVTGQQPGLLWGPLLSSYKVLGAVALARELSRRWGTRVVPVYWCGADDTDFDEVRGAWLWEPGKGPFRAALDGAVRRAGQDVGSIDDPSVDRIERDALARAGAANSSTTVHASLADRARTRAMSTFADDGLVTVDARSSRLRELGRPLFERYARDAAAVAAELDASTRTLERDGWTPAIDAVARRSALFEIVDGIRTKIDADALVDVVASGRPLAPSVMLRPVWQDALLAPVASVLGPAELQYHAQIAPIYHVLGVDAARPVPRPHVVVADPDGPAPDDVLLSGRAERGAMGSLPEDWSRALESIEEAAERALASLPGLGVRAGRETEVLRHRLRREVARTTDRLRLARARDDGRDPHRVARWYGVRGVPQERVYAAAQWDLWFGDAAVDARAAVAAAYVDAIDTARNPGWCVSTSPRSVATAHGRKERSGIR